MAARFPVHVTVRLKKGLPRLRNKATYRVLRKAFVAGSERFGFRLCEFSVQGNHLHLIAEAKDRRSFSRGMQGLLIRVSKGLNRLWERRGRVFADRYHDRVLRTPREVRCALAYVLNNARRHGLRLPWPIDLYSSGPWFSGWKRGSGIPRPSTERPVSEGRTWLLREGWRRAGGGIPPDEVPGPAVSLGV